MGFVIKSEWRCIGSSWLTFYQCLASRYQSKGQLFCAQVFFGSNIIIECPRRKKDATFGSANFKGAVFRLPWLKRIEYWCLSTVLYQRNWRGMCSFEIICMTIHSRRVGRAQRSKRRNIKKRHKSVVISSHQRKIWKPRLLDVWYHVSKNKIEWINLAMGRINAVTGCKVAIQIRRGFGKY